MSDASGIDVGRLQNRIIDSLGVPADRAWHIAYSGGLDSTVLLHILIRVCGAAGSRLIAVHADHGLHAHSHAWRQQCEDQCRAWGVAFHATKLSLGGADKLGPEGRARTARYRWFREIAGDGGWLFTAHHRRDLAETVIERLMRGSGPQGLRGILPLSRLQGMHVVRPLLDVPREAIRIYAEHHDLEWVTDDSNLDSSFTRNYTRNQVLPVLRNRWPGVETALGRTAGIMADAQRILDEEAAVALERLDEQRIRGDPSLDIPAMQALTPERRRNALRHWIRREAGVSPGFSRLGRIARAVEHYPQDAGGLRWPPVELRLFHGRLYLVHRRAPAPEARPWDLKGVLDVGEGIVLRPREAAGRGIKKAAMTKPFTVGFRQGGEKCRLPGRRHRHKLKHVLQDAGVPPWQRSRIPLIRVNGDIAAVAGLTCCDPYAAGPGEAGIEIEVAYS